MTPERIKEIRNQFKYSHYPLNVMSGEMLDEIEGLMAKLAKCREVLSQLPTDFDIDEDEILLNN